MDTMADNLVGHILQVRQRRPGAFGLEAEGHGSSGDVGIAHAKDGEIATHFSELLIGASLATRVVKVRPLGNRA